MTPTVIGSEQAGRLVEACIRGAHIRQIRHRAASGKGDPECFSGRGLAVTELTELERSFAALVAAGPPTGARERPPHGEACVRRLLESKIRLSQRLPVSALTEYLRARAKEADISGIRAIANLYQVTFERTRDANLLQDLFKLYAKLNLPVYLDDIGLPYDRAEFAAMGQALAEACCETPYDTSPQAWHLASRKIKNWGEEHSGKKTAATYARELLGRPEIMECVPAIKSMPLRRIGVLGHSFVLSLHWSTHASFTDIAAAVIRSLNPDVEFVSEAHGDLHAPEAYRKYTEPLVALRPDAVLLVLAVRTNRDVAAFKKIVARLRAVGAEVCAFDDITGSLVPNSGPTPHLVKEAGATVIEVRQILERHPRHHEFLALDRKHMTSAYHNVMAAELVKFLAGGLLRSKR